MVLPAREQEQICKVNMIEKSTKEQQIKNKIIKVKRIK
jgi:hypothetical protein